MGMHPSPSFDFMVWAETRWRYLHDTWSLDLFSGCTGRWGREPDALRARRWAHSEQAVLARRICARRREVSSDSSRPAARSTSGEVAAWETPQMPETESYAGL